MSYSSLFSSHPSYGASQSAVREELPSYRSPVMQRYESFENPLVGPGSPSFDSQDEEQVLSCNPQFGTALYDFTAGGDDEVNRLLLCDVATSWKLGISRKIFTRHKIVDGRRKGVGGMGSFPVPSFRDLDN
ncbi:hypothetical protein Ancab_007122 [Ancistrocladus abbreviatus]